MMYVTWDLWAGREEKGREWWSDEVGVVVAENRWDFEEWLQRRDTVTYDRYRAQKAVVKQTGKVAKTIADWRVGERLSAIEDRLGELLGNDLEGNTKMF